jgi:Family of unknown function (DUF6494)
MEVRKYLKKVGVTSQREIGYYCPSPEIVKSAQWRLLLLL